MIDQHPSGLWIPSTDATSSNGSRNSRGNTRAPRLVNTRSGAGGATDKDVTGEFVATRLAREQAERLWQMSWAAGKLVDIPVDDMFLKGRRFTGDDKAANDAMRDADDELNAMSELAEAIRASRIWGSALLVVATDNNDELPEPLDPDDITEGSLRNFIVYDRWAVEYETVVDDPSEFGYGHPYTYRVHGRRYGRPPADGNEQRSAFPIENFIVHRDRIFRFDGRRSPLTEGWTTGPWEREWGVSVLTRAIDDIMRDASSMAATGHLMQQSSVWVQRVKDLKESLMGRGAKDEPTPEEMAEATNLLLSIYRILFIDAGDEAERIAVAWSGLADVLDVFANRIAAIENIPITRFRGTSATGLNATGDGDARDWRIQIKAMQTKVLGPRLRRLDKMLARHAGLAEPPDYEWVPLGEETPRERAEVFQLFTEGTVAAYEKGLVDEDEGRAVLSTIEEWGELGAWTEPEAELMRREEQSAQLEAMQTQMANDPEQDPDGSPVPESDEDED